MSLCRHRCGTTAMAVFVSALAMACASSRSALPTAAMSPSAKSAEEIVPADLDVALRLDLVRLRGLWSLAPNRQIARILAEYGVFSATTDAEAAFWLQLLAQSQSLRIGCRPVRGGCRDAVVFARGRYDRQGPLSVLPDTSLPLDLGAGWFRYARKVKVGRQQAARVYLAPPDRMVVVSPAEVDAVERSLEEGHVEATTLRVEERGLFSMTLRPTAIARLVESRAPAAARLLRDATVIRLWLDADANALELTANVGFANPSRAERAREAFSLLLAILNGRKSTPEAAAEPLQVVGNYLVLHLHFLPPSLDLAPSPRESIPGNSAEPAAQ